MDGTYVATVVIADDAACVRDALTGLLDDHPKLRVVGRVGTGVGAAKLCELHQPSLALVDVMMPDGGEFAIRAILKVSPATIVSVYTARSDRPTRNRMLAAGASAVFTKGGASDLASELAELWTSWHGSGRGRHPSVTTRDRNPDSRGTSSSTVQ